MRLLREEGHGAGSLRPVTLVPFPSDAMAAAGRRAEAVAVYENNTGQMVDDVRLGGPERHLVDFIEA